MKNILDFLKELHRHNDRDWFEANKQWYKEVKDEFDVFTEGLIKGISGFDKEVAKSNLTAKDCTYRIYRDVRFSTNKESYKTHFGAYVCRGGKKSGLSGYYFHVEPRGAEGMLGGSLLSVGMYMPQPAELKSIRMDIMDRGEEFIKVVKKARGFELSEESKMKRVPAGFPADSPYAEYLKLKDVYIQMLVGDDYMTAPGLLERSVEAFRGALDFNGFMNRAVLLAREEM